MITVSLSITDEHDDMILKKNLFLARNDFHHHYQNHHSPDRLLLYGHYASEHLTRYQEWNPEVFMYCVSWAI